MRNFLGRILMRNKCPRCGHPVRFHRTAGSLVACDYEADCTRDEQCNCTFYLDLEFSKEADEYLGSLTEELAAERFLEADDAIN
jgi:hypothetical protein